MLNRYSLCSQDRVDGKSKPRSDRVVEIVRGHDDDKTKSRDADKDSKRDRERERRDEDRTKVCIHVVLLSKVMSDFLIY